jgi:hypothetical protein
MIGLEAGSDDELRQVIQAHRDRPGPKGLAGDTERL